jgi:hypothetical protein
MTSLINKIWSSPRETMREVKNPNMYLSYFSFIVGFVALLDYATRMALGNYMNRPLIIVLSVVLAIPVGYILLNIFAFFIFITGKALMGRGRFRQVRCALAFSRAPMLINVFSWIALIVLYYPTLFSKELSGHMQAHDYGLLFFLLVIQLIFAIYALVLLVGALSVVQEFGLWKSFFNLVFQGILIGVCVAILQYLWYGNGFSAHFSSLLNYISFGVHS